MLLGNGFEPDPRVLEEARAMIRAGARVEIIGWDRDRALPPEEVYEGIRIRRIRLKSTHGRGRGQTPFMLAFWARATKMALGTGCDVIWCHDLDTLPVGHAVARLKGARVVFDAHESYPDMVAESVGRFVTGALRRLERFLVARVDAVVTVGRRLAEHFTGMGARRVVVAGNWKRPEAFALSPREREGIRAELGLPANAFAVSSIGWLSTERQLEPLLEAVERTPDVWLLLGGRGPMEAACRAAAARCPRIRFAGWVDADRVPAFTAACDAVYYGFDPANGNARFSAPNKLFEAVAAGIPVITGPFGEIEEIVRREECGVVLPDYGAESVRAGLARVRLTERFSAGCHRARYRYSRARADEEVRDLLEGLAPGRGSRAPASVWLEPQGA